MNTMAERNIKFQTATRIKLESSDGKNMNKNPTNCIYF